MVPFWRRAPCPSVGGQRCWAQLNRRSVSQSPFALRSIPFSSRFESQSSSRRSRRPHLLGTARLANRAAASPAARQQALLKALDRSSEARSFLLCGGRRRPAGEGLLRALPSRQRQALQPAAHSAGRLAPLWLSAAAVVRQRGRPSIAYQPGRWLTRRCSCHRGRGFHGRWYRSGVGAQEP